MTSSSRLVDRSDGFEVVDNETDLRYEARLDGELAGWIQYRPLAGWTVLVHTESLPAFAGRGVASRLVRAALDDIRARGLHVTPACPYVAAYIHRHVEYRDLVVGLRGPRSRGSSKVASDRE
jgi:predicted GNAT family acetyltransferase